SRHSTMARVFSSASRSRFTAITGMRTANVQNDIPPSEHPFDASFEDQDRDRRACGCPLTGVTLECGRRRGWSILLPAPRRKPAHYDREHLANRDAGGQLHSKQAA